MVGLLRAESRRVPDAPWVLSSHALSADEGSVLNAVVAHPTQRRLLIALVVTLLCLPVLVLDLLSGPASSSATEVASTSSDSSLVVATQSATTDATTDVTVDPSGVEMDAPSPVVTEPAPTTTAPKAPQTTTTTAPRPTVTAAPRPAPSAAEFLACVRWRESHNDYTASDPTGTFLGAYQIYQGGWDSMASVIGRTDLVGVPPNHASPADQDAIAAAMYARYGSAPWGGYCT